MLDGGIMVKKGKRYRTTRDISYGDEPFRLVEGQEFTEADLQPGMEAALAKWIRVGAAEVIEVKQAEVVAPIIEEEQEV